MLCGIYKISLKTYPKVRVLYVGQSMWIENRWKGHKYSLKNKNHFNPHLQNIYNKHGGQNFVYEIICECIPSALDGLEQFYIDELKPECNIVRDIKNFYDKFRMPENSFIIICIKEDDRDLYRPAWHKKVYGCG